MSNTEAQFAAAWLAAQTPEVQALIATTPVGTARTSALELLAKKYAAQSPPVGLDREILQLGEPPYWTMWARGQYGYTWVPAIGQPPIPCPPGYFMLNEPPYDPSKPPAGSIKVVDPATCDLAKEFPAAVAQKPAPAPSTALVDFSRPWPDMGPGAFFGTFLSLGVPAGSPHTEGGRDFTKVIVPFAFGPGWHGWIPAPPPTGGNA